MNVAKDAGHSRSASFLSTIALDFTKPLATYYGCRRFFLFVDMSGNSDTSYAYAYLSAVVDSDTQSFLSNACPPQRQCEALYNITIGRR